MIVVTMLQVSWQDPYNCCDYVAGIMAGSPCPIEIMKQVIDVMHMPDVTVSDIFSPLPPS